MNIDKIASHRRLRDCSISFVRTKDSELRYRLEIKMERESVCSWMRAGARGACGPMDASMHRLTMTIADDPFLDPKGICNGNSQFVELLDLQIIISILRRCKFFSKE